MEPVEDNLDINTARLLDHLTAVERWARISWTLCGETKPIVPARRIVVEPIEAP